MHLDIPSTECWLVIKYTRVFQALICCCCFLSRKHIIQWINAPASRERKLDFQFLTYFSSSTSCIKKRPLDFNTIYRNWPAAYTLYIHTHICKLNECITFIFMSNHYFRLNRLADKRTQWPTLLCEWFCNSEANHHEIRTRLRK